MALQKALISATQDQKFDRINHKTYCSDQASETNIKCGKKS